MREDNQLFFRPTLFQDAKRSLLSNSGEFCDCLSSEHILTNAQCRLNIILLSYPHLAFLFEESATPIVKAIKEDEEDTDRISLKEEQISACYEKDDCGAEPFQPYTLEEHEAIAKKLCQIAEKLSSSFIADDPCPSPPLKKTDSAVPFSGYGDVLDGLLSPQIGAIPVQQIQVCALQVMVSAPENKLHEQSPNQESARPSAEEPRAQQIVCAAVSRDPRISRTSVGKETYLLSFCSVYYF